MKLFELITTAHAQFEVGGPSEGGSGFDITDFNFLRIFSPDNPGEASRQFNDLFGAIVSIVLAIAAIVAFFYLVISGIQYMTAGGDAAKAQAARQGIINALIGIVVILVSYLLLRYVGTFLN